jgi:hypothetical protein
VECRGEVMTAMSLSDERVEEELCSDVRRGMDSILEREFLDCAVYSRFRRSSRIFHRRGYQISFMD